MELYLHQNGEQVGPYTPAQIAEAVASGQLTRNDIVWHEGLPEWLPIHEVLSLPPPISPAPATQKLVNPSTPPASNREITTNVKQGAIIGGWICFGLGAVIMFLSLWLFFLYGPFFLVAFILSIIAMSQRRLLGGVALLTATLVVPPIIFGIGGIGLTQQMIKRQQQLQDEMTQEGEASPDEQLPASEPPGE